MSLLRKLILWDWDNTLVDTFMAILAAQNDTRIHFGLDPWSAQESKKVMNKSGKNVLLDVFGPDRLAEARAYYLQKYAEHAREIELKEGAKDILAFAKAKGFINVLASNKAGAILRNEADMLGTTHFFDRIIGAEDTYYSKPSKDFTDAAIDGFLFDKLISIGDGRSDIQMGRNYENGMGILVWTDPDTPEFDEIRPHYAFKNLTDVQDFLFDLLEG